MNRAGSEALATSIVALIVVPHNLTSCRTTFSCTPRTERTASTFTGVVFTVTLVFSFPCWAPVTTAVTPLIGLRVQLCLQSAWRELYVAIILFHSNQHSEEFRQMSPASSVVHDGIGGVMPKSFAVFTLWNPWNGICLLTGVLIYISITS